MDQTFFLSTLDQVRALSDPLRLKILKALTGEALTTHQVASRLGEKPTRLYHHVALLESAGLIRLVETRPKRGTVEKYYQAVSGQFMLDYRLFQGQNPAPEAFQALQALYQGLLQETAGGIAPAHSLDPGLPLVLVQRELRITPEKAAELRSQLQAWIEACQAAEDLQGKAVYQLTVGFFPVSGTEVS